MAQKNVEARVNDPKRQLLKVGDELLVLKRPDESESLTVRITKLKYFSNFTELADYYPIERLYSPSFTKEEYLALFPKFYSEEEIAKYGTVAIEFELIKSSAANADR